MAASYSAQLQASHRDCAAGVLHIMRGAELLHAQGCEGGGRGAAQRRQERGHGVWERADAYMISSEADLPTSVGIVPVSEL